MLLQLENRCKTVLDLIGIDRWSRRKIWIKNSTWIKGV